MMQPLVTLTSHRSVHYFHFIERLNLRDIYENNSFLHVTLVGSNAFFPILTIRQRYRSYHSSTTNKTVLQLIVVTV